MRPNISSKCTQRTAGPLYVGFALAAISALLSPMMIEFLAPSKGAALDISYFFYLVAWQVVVGLLACHYLLGGPKKSLLKIAMAGACLLISILICELFIRRFWYKHEVSGWKAKKISKLEKNQLGYRGHIITYTPQDFVIVLLGDSQVEATACGYDWMPESRLEAHLSNATGPKVRVISLGAAGYGQDQQLLALKEYFKKYRADLVLLWLTPENDFWNNTFPTHWAKNGPLKPTYWLTGGQLNGPTSPIGVIPCRGSRCVDLLRRNLRQGGNDKDGTWERKFLPAAYKPSSTYAGPYVSDWQERWDDDIGGARGENLQNEKSHWAMSLTPRSPRMQYSIDLTRMLMLQIKALSEANGAPMRVFYCPEPGQQQTNDVVHRLNGRYYRTSASQRDANIADAIRGLDAIPVFLTMNNPLMGPDDKHLNQHAVDECMRLLSLSLRKDSDLH